MPDHGLDSLIRSLGLIQLVHLWNLFLSFWITSTKFHWDDKLDQVFIKSKELLISKINEGIHTFNITKKTCLHTDCSIDDTGYLLLPEHCNCNSDKAPVCCNEGWKLIYVGSCFTHETKSRYSPTKGKVLAVFWNLEHSKMFTLECNNLNHVLAWHERKYSKHLIHMPKM